MHAVTGAAGAAGTDGGGNTCVSGAASTWGGGKAGPALCTLPRPWALCKWLFIKARTTQECGSLPGLTGKEPAACSTGLEPGGVELRRIVLPEELNGLFVNTAS